MWLIFLVLMFWLVNIEEVVLKVIFGWYVSELIWFVVVYVVMIDELNLFIKFWRVMFLIEIKDFCNLEGSLMCIIFLSSGVESLNFVCFICINGMWW